MGGRPPVRSEANGSGGAVGGAADATAADAFGAGATGDGAAGAHAAIPNVKTNVPKASAVFVSTGAE